MKNLPFLLLIAILYSSVVAAQNVGINSIGQAPHPSAIPGISLFARGNHIEGNHANLPPSENMEDDLLAATCSPGMATFHGFQKYVWMHCCNTTEPFL